METPEYNKTGVPSLKSRPQRWNKEANTVYVETPAMTGFSYCDNDCAWDDESTADAHYQMTLAFFDKFPEFKERELYFTGWAPHRSAPYIVDRVDRFGNKCSGVSGRATLGCTFPCCPTEF